MRKGRFYLTTLWDEEKDAFICVISEGHAAAGDGEVIVCTVALHKTQRAARAWFRAQMKSRPWETRQ